MTTGTKTPPATTAVAPWKATGGQRRRAWTPRAPTNAPTRRLEWRGNTEKKAISSAAAAGISSHDRLITTATAENTSSASRLARLQT